MIKFFRKIRQRLLTENKFSKYLLYAIGEIILVVIGILIALSINNWNENRKITKEEKQALINIQRDFIENKRILIELMDNTKKATNSSLEMLTYSEIRKEPNTEDTFNALLNGIFDIKPYYPQNGFLDALLNSGKLGIFKNVDLRNLLSSWESRLEIQNRAYFSIDDDSDILNLYINKKGSWLNADELIAEKQTITFPKSRFKIDNRNLLKELEFENLIENNTLRSDMYFQQQKRTLELLDSIINLIETETNNE